jgi:hypothetical protein
LSQSVTAPDYDGFLDRNAAPVAVLTPAPQRSDPRSTPVSEPDRSRSRQRPREDGRRRQSQTVQRAVPTEGVSDPRRSEGEGRGGKAARTRKGPNNTKNKGRPRRLREADRTS